MSRSMDLMLLHSPGQGRSILKVLSEKGVAILAEKRTKRKSVELHIIIRST